MRNEKGYSLLELLFTVTLIPVLAVSLYSVLDMSNVIFRTSGSYSEVSQGGVQSLRYIGRELGQSSTTVTPARFSITADAQGNSVLRFQIPVDWDNDGDAVCWDSDNNGNCDQTGEQTQTSVPITEWGAYTRTGETQGGLLNNWVQYSVVANALTGRNQLVRQVVDAAFNPVANAPTQVIADNVTGFVANQPSLNTVRTQLTMLVTERIGQGSARNFTPVVFQLDTMLRNTLN